MSDARRLITHSHPPATTEAVEVARRRRRARPAGGWSPTAEELAKHGDAADGIEAVDELPDDARPLPRARRRRLDPHALRRFARTGVPVFGVNFGTVGFLAAVERDEAEQGIRRAFAGETETIDLPGLEIEVDGERRVALNDVSFSRRPHDRVAELSYRIAGEEVGHVRCDGLVAATPVGSTGYNLANQGPILAWGVKGYVVSYIAPHSLTARALVVAPGDVLHVGNAAGREPVDVAVDGDQAGDARRRAPSSRSASPTTSAASPSCPGRASTSASARSSATSPSEPSDAGSLGFRRWSANGGPSSSSRSRRSCCCSTSRSSTSPCPTSSANSTPASPACSGSSTPTR